VCVDVAVSDRSIQSVCVCVCVCEYERTSHRLKGKLIPGELSEGIMSAFRLEMAARCLLCLLVCVLNNCVN